MSEKQDFSARTENVLAQCPGNGPVEKPIKLFDKETGKEINWEEHFQQQKQKDAVKSGHQR